MRSAYRALILGAIFFPLVSHAANGLPCSNPHLATKADVAAGYPAGAYVCPQDEQVVSPESGTAREELEKRVCKKQSNCMIRDLNPNFKICSAKLLKLVPQQNACILRAYEGICGRVAQSGSFRERGLSITLRILDGREAALLVQKARAVGLIFNPQTKTLTPRSKQCMGDEKSTPVAGKSGSFPTNNASPNGNANMAYNPQNLYSPSNSGGASSDATLQGSGNGGIDLDPYLLSHSESPLAPIGRPGSSLNYESLGYSPPAPKNDFAEKAIAEMAAMNDADQSEIRTPIITPSIFQNAARLSADSPLAMAGKRDESTLPIGDTTLPTQRESAVFYAAPIPTFVQYAGFFVTPMGYTTFWRTI